MLSRVAIPSAGPVASRSTNLGPNVVVGWRADNGEANEEDICLRVGEWSQSIVVFLSSSIPQSQADWLSINHHTCRVVVEAEAKILSEWLSDVLMLVASTPYMKVKLKRGQER